MKPKQLKDLSGSLGGQNYAEATEMAVIAWTYAACLEIGIDPVIVFHPDVYKCDGENILENFNHGRYFGVPILGLYGMTERVTNTQQNNTVSYPKMLIWVRA